MKMLILFQDAVTNLSQKYVSCIGRGVPQGHNYKISGHSESFMINRTKSKLKNY